MSVKYNPYIHNRRSIRLKGYDYSSKGLYFITLCSQNRAHIFGEVLDGAMKLNELGTIVNEEWVKTTDIRRNVSLHEYIIMPNHFHAIIEILFSENPSSKENSENINATFKSPSQTIGAIIRGFKGSTTKKIKEYIFNLRPGELQLTPANIKKDSTGELQFAPPNKNKDSTGELQFAPPNKNIDRTGELQFARTDIKKRKQQFARTFAPYIDLSKSIWQRNYYEHIIRDEKAYFNISNYIKNNPQKWDDDKFHQNQK